MTDLKDIAPDFVDMAHRIVWCTAATVDTAGKPRTRVLHPIWEWDGEDLVGWIATSPQSLKARHLAETPQLSCTYWVPEQDTCSADCDVTWQNSAEERQAGWDRFKNAAAPVGYDPGMIPGWAPDAESFGILKLQPYRLRLMPGSGLLTGEGVLTWAR